jgi:hypothetical protein
MHPLDQMCAYPEVAATFVWLDPPNNEGLPRRWRVTIPKHIFDRHKPMPTWLFPNPTKRPRKKKGEAVPVCSAPNPVAV